MNSKFIKEKKKKVQENPPVKEEITMDIKYFELSKNTTQTSWDAKAMYMQKFITLNA